MIYFTRKKQFNKRAIVSGNILELYEYEKPVFKGTEKKIKGRANSPFTSCETKNENRSKVASRARAKVRRTVNSNPYLNKFFTLTFSKNITDLQFAWYEFEKFTKRLKTRYKKFQYVVVVEFQKRGAVHYHLLCNLPYISANELATIWGNGFVKINRIDNVDNVGAYITKYMTKDSIDERLIGRKCYAMSRGLNNPTEYTNEKEIEYIMENLENVKRTNSFEFETDYYGKVVYTQVVCTAPIKARKRPRLILLPDTTPCPFPI